jgi:hypothetical protein
VNSSDTVILAIGYWNDVHFKTIFDVEVIFPDSSRQYVGSFDASNSITYNPREQDLVFSANNDNHASTIAASLTEVLSSIDSYKVIGVIFTQFPGIHEFQADLKLYPNLKHIVAIPCFREAVGKTLVSILGQDQIVGILDAAFAIRRSLSQLDNHGVALDSGSSKVGSGFSVRSLLFKGNQSDLSSMYAYLVALHRHYPAILDVLNNLAVPTATAVSDVHGDLAYAKSSQFEADLNALITLMRPFMEALMTMDLSAYCLSLSDAASKWIQIVSSTELWLTQQEIAQVIASETMDHVKYAINKRTKELPASLCELALFLDPRYRKSIVIDAHGVHLEGLATAAVNLLSQRGHPEGELIDLVLQIRLYGANASPFNILQFGGSSKADVETWWRSMPDHLLMIKSLAIMMLQIQAVTPTSDVMNMLEYGRIRRKVESFAVKRSMTKMITSYYQNEHTSLAQTLTSKRRRADSLSTPIKKLRPSPGIAFDVVHAADVHTLDVLHIPNNADPMDEGASNISDDWVINFLCEQHQYDCSAVSATNDQAIFNTSATVANDYQSEESLRKNDHGLYMFAFVDSSSLGAEAMLTVDDRRAVKIGVLPVRKSENIVMTTAKSIVCNILS